MSTFRRQNNPHAYSTAALGRADGRE